MEDIYVFISVCFAVIFSKYFVGLLVRWPWMIIADTSGDNKTVKRLKTLRVCLVIGQFTLALIVILGTYLFFPDLFQISKKLFFSVGISILIAGILNYYIAPRIFGGVFVNPPVLFLEIMSSTPLMTESEIELARKDFKKDTFGGFWVVIIVHIPIALALAITAGSHYFGLALLSFSLIVRMIYKFRKST